MPLVAGIVRCGQDNTECVTVLLGLSPEPSPHRTLGLSECLDNLALGLSSLSDPKHAAHLLPRSTRCDCRPDRLSERLFDRHRRAAAFAHGLQRIFLPGAMLP